MLAAGSKYLCDSLIRHGYNDIMSFVTIKLDHQQEMNLLGTRARRLRDKDPDKLRSMTKQSSFTSFLP